MFEISPAIGCPIDCLECAQSVIQSAYQGPRLMTMDTFIRCIQKVPDPLVSFAGFAEPYLNPDCTSMIRFTHAMGKTCQLYTTCIGMTLDDVEAIRHIDFKIVCLHLPDRDGHAKIKITPDYLAVVDAMAEAFPKAQMMQLGVMHPTMEKYAGRIKATYIHTRAGNIQNAHTGPVMMKQRGPLKCRMSPELVDNVLLPDGSIAVCCSDWSLQHLLGNLLTQSWQEIRDGDPLARLRDEMASENGFCLCRQCEFAVSA